MGTDMTTFIELWDDNDKEWKFFLQEHAVRSYPVFERIGGVRGHWRGNDAFHNRGVPKHMSWWVEKELNKENYYHSVTYYSGKDLLDTVIGYEIKDEDFEEDKYSINFDFIMGDYEFNGVWDTMMHALLDKVGPTNIRFIFAFDS